MSSARAHVLFVLPLLELSGAERIVFDLARRLPGLGFSTEVVGLERADTHYAEQLRAAGIPARGLGLSRRRSLACARALRESLPAQRPLLVHGQMFHGMIAARWAVAGLDAEQRRGVLALSTSHIVERRFRPWHGWLNRFTARHAACEVCVSPAVAAFQAQWTGLPQSFFPVIENGVDLGAFRPGATRSEPPRVVSVGRLDPQKDPLTLLRAWRHVEAAHPSAVLELAGTGPLRSQLERAMKELGLKRVILCGFVDDIPAFLRGAAVYVQASRWEGFGLAVAEALACGIPAVVSAVDSLPTVVREGQDGLLVPPGDAPALGVKIIQLLKNDSMRREFAENAARGAQERFSVDTMAARYAELYAELLQRV